MIEFISRPAAEIRRLAAEFLLKYGCEEVALVDLEEIASYDLEIDIQVRASLHANRGIEAAISYDLKTIYLDTSVFDNDIRWNYAVAHELAHVILHADYIQSLPCESDRQLTEAIVNIPDDKQGDLLKSAFR